MMCAHLLKPRAEEREGRLARTFERGFAGMLGVYERSLRWVLTHQPETLLVTVGTVLLTALLAVVIPKGFFPLQDTGLIVGVSVAQPDASFTRMTNLQRAIDEVILSDPDVASIASSIGADGVNPTSNSGRVSITLKPRSQRNADVSEISARLQPRLAGVPGITLYLQPVQDLTIETRTSRTQFQYTLEDADPGELQEWAPRMLEKMRQLPQLADVASDEESDGLQLKINIDRDTASRLGVSPQAVDDTLYDAYGQRQITTIFTQLNQYRVILDWSRNRPSTPSRSTGSTCARRAASRCPSPRSRRRRRRSRRWPST